MNFFRRIGILIYMLMMLGAGAVVLVLSLNIISAENLSQWVGLINENMYSQAAAVALGGLFLLIGVISPFRMSSGLKSKRMVSFQNPDGEVTVSLSAIEDYIRKISRSIPGIKDVRSHVNMTKKGIDITADVSVTEGANIPEITERIQVEVKNRVHSMIGVEENINMSMHVRRIVKGGRVTEAPVGEELPEAAQVPFREGGSLE
ncbi:MAG: alkaline shock response membrane anchor protein AmaP [Candidatus Omnitrophica bacterium]|nr:alkaline shock response membrane anchor protein AmaP [Candidatus Omnitrophota bacterium]